MTSPTAPSRDATHAGQAASQTAGDVLRRLRALAVVPVLVIDDPDAAAPLGAALAAGGLPCAEVTFRTPGAGEALRRMAAAHPGMLLGAGTVLTAAQVAEARAAGAAFVVSPGFNPAVAEACLGQGVPFYPGVCTPTEIEAALAMGLRVLKFFPAEAMGGVATLRAIAAPYAGIEFMPTGGIGPQTLGGYLALPQVVACGGSWMAPPAWVAARQFERVREETARAVTAARRPGGGGGGA